MPSSEQGVNLERYMFVPRTLIFVLRGENVLLIKGAAQKRLWAGLYNGIGGHVEPGEDIYSSAQRELLEETGLDIPNLALCGIVTVDTGINPGVSIFVFTAEYLEGEIKKSKEGSLEWINSSEIGKIPLVTDLPELLPKVIKFTHDHKLFFAHSEYDHKGQLIIKFR